MAILIHFSSKYSHDLKLAALSYYTNRMIYLPPTQAGKQEMNMICTIAQNSEFLKHIVLDWKKTDI